jgi:dihydroneopterin aldolase
MTIDIQDLKFYAIIGILDFERDTAQEIVVDLSIVYKYDNEFINYADVVETIKKNIITAKYLLIEEALEGLSVILLKKFPLIDKLIIKLTKPSIMPDCRVSVSGEF